ncbi:MAG TPA: tripartite tricarboxylate transporter permease [Candidatus Limnocylindrales bacterium]|nr:tripartite tricarboxylate transporter permease [Candidatus Limnocylindrales bacterium]
MDAVSGLLYGLSVALQPQNLVAAGVGVTLGSVVGVLPGIGPLTSLAILLPVSFYLDPTSGLILMAGVYYGAMYGGSTTAILLGLPGESSSVMTVLDGYKLRLMGRAGPAMTMAALASFVAGILATFGLAFLGVPLASYALAFGPIEVLALALVGVSLVVVLSANSLVKGTISACLGFLLATVGTDIISGVPRFTFGLPDALGGINLVDVVLGLFAVGEVLHALVKPEGDQGLPKGNWLDFRALIPSLDDLRVSWLPTLRQSVLGFLLGVMPGTGAVAASFIAYGTEQRLAKPDRAKLFGEGAMEGVCAPEAANNAAAQGAFVPMLTLGIPGSPAAAVLMGALIIHGLEPGPQLFQTNPDVVWGLIASMLIGNLMLIVLNVPLVGLFIQMLRIPFPALSVLTILLSVVGAFAVQNSLFDVLLVFLFGGVGLLMRLHGYPLAPLVLAMVLGPIVERSLYQGLLIAHGDPIQLVASPIPAVIYGILGLMLVLKLVQTVLRRGPRLAVEEDEGM